MTDSPFRRLWARMRPKWAWVSLALGLPWLLLSGARSDGAGCGRALSGLAFWVGFLVLLFYGFRWLWQKLLFRVSRRLWMILLLLSFLPAFLLTGLFLSVGWLALGGQVGRTLQASVKSASDSLRQAAGDPKDEDAVRSLRWLGNITVVHVRSLPPGVGPGFVGLVWNENSPINGKGVFLRAVSRDGEDFRLLNVSMGTLADRGRDLWGGRIHYRLDRTTLQPIRGRVGAKEDINLEAFEPTPIAKGVPALSEWFQGEALRGSALLHPFRLPSVGLSIRDWRSGRQDLLLTATPETSLGELWRGYDFHGAYGNRSFETLLAQLVIVLTLLCGLCLQGVAMITGLVLARQLGKSVDDLFVGVHRLATGDFGTRIRPRTKDQVGRLAQAFNSMAMTMEQSLSERQKRQALEEELRVAREVQMHLLPDIPVLPQGSAVHATLLPAKDVAGDYYDLFRLEDGRLAFLVADVSGKGTSAAFYAAETKGVVAALDKIRRGPREVVQRLNEIWLDGHGRKPSMTVVHRVVDPDRRPFACVPRCHPAPSPRVVDGTVSRLNPRGLGIGMVRDRFPDYLELCEGRLEPGDCLLLYTDGLSEAAGPDGSLFGEERIREVLEGGGVEVQARLLSAASGHTGGGAMEDDLTLLLLQRS